MDIDPDALDVCSSNLEEFEISNVDLVLGDVKQLAATDVIFREKFDTVVMNPPFGTKHNKGQAAVSLEILCQERNSSQITPLVTIVFTMLKDSFGLKAFFYKSTMSTQVCSEEFTILNTRANVCLIA